MAAWELLIQSISPPHLFCLPPFLTLIPFPQGGRCTFCPSNTQLCLSKIWPYQWTKLPENIWNQKNGLVSVLRRCFSQIPRVEELGCAPSPWSVRVSQRGKAQAYPGTHCSLQRLRDTTGARDVPFSSASYSVQHRVRSGSSRSPPAATCEWQCVDGCPRAAPLTGPAAPLPDAHRAVLNTPLHGTPELTK